MGDDVASVKVQSCVLALQSRMFDTLFQGLFEDAEEDVVVRLAHSTMLSSASKCASIQR